MEDGLSLGLVLALIKKIATELAASYAAVGVLSITGATDGSGLVVKYTDGRADSTIPFVNIMTTTTYDANGNGIVDNSEQLNGQDASYYLNSTNIDFSDSNFTATDVQAAIVEVFGKYVTIDNIITAINNDITSLTSQVNTKQDELVSGTNIKTINGESLLGSGNITISGGGGSGDVTTAEFEAYKQEVSDEFDTVNTRIDGIETGSGFVTQEDFDEYKVDVTETYVTTDVPVGSTEGSNLLVADALSSSEGNKTFDDIKALIDAGGSGESVDTSTILGYDEETNDTPSTLSVEPIDDEPTLITIKNHKHRTAYYPKTTVLGLKELVQNPSDATKKVIDPEYIDGYTKEVIDEKFNNIEIDDFSSEYEAISAVFSIPANSFLEVVALDGIDLTQYSTPILSTADGTNVAWGNPIYVGNNKFHVRNLSTTAVLSGGYLSAKKQKGIAVDGGGSGEGCDCNLPDDFYNESTSLVNSTYIDASNLVTLDKMGDIPTDSTIKKYVDDTVASGGTFVPDNYYTKDDTNATFATKVELSNKADTSITDSLSTDILNQGTEITALRDRIIANETELTNMSSSVKTLNDDLEEINEKIDSYLKFEIIEDEGEDTNE